MLRTLLISFLIIVASITNAQSIQADFEIKGLDVAEVYIGYHFGTQKYILDTVAVTNGKFQLKVADPKMGIYFIYTPGYSFEFILDNHSFSLSTTKLGGYRDLKVTNSKENEVFKLFQLSMIDYQMEQRDLEQKFSGLKGKDSVDVRNEMLAIGVKVESFKKDLISNYPGTFVAGFVKLLIEPAYKTFPEITDIKERSLKEYNYYQSHYFEKNQLRDARLLRTPIIQPKVSKYLDEVVIQHPDTLIKHIDIIMDQVGSDPENFRFWLVTFFKKYSETKIMGMDAVMIHLIEKYYLSGKADWISADYEKKLREEVAYVKHSLIGKQAPPLNVVDSLMQHFELSSVQSEYTLLFLYDPDCGHCKKTVKEMEEHEIEMEKAGIQLVAVCTTTNVERWKKFIQEHNPSWHHAIDPSGQSYFRVYYNVRSTPKLYLLDANKKIIAKNLEIQQFIDVVNNR